MSYTKFNNACLDGDVTEAKRAYAAEGLTPDAIRNDRAAALRHACCRGGVDLVRWLCDAGGLTRADVISGPDSAFSNTGANRLAGADVARYLVERYNLTAVAVRASDFLILWKSIPHGNLEHAKYVSGLLPPAEFAAVIRRCHFHRVAAGGDRTANNLEMLKWLDDLVELTRAEVVADDCGLVARAVEGDQAEIVGWLFSTYNLTKEMAATMRAYAVANGSENVHAVLSEIIAASREGKRRRVQA
jgi:hypothetical protein